MRNRSLRILFRHAVLAVAPTTLAIGAYACDGGTASSSAANDDAATIDVAVHDANVMETASGCAGGPALVVFAPDAGDLDAADGDDGNSPDASDAGCWSVACLDAVFPSDGGLLRADECDFFCGSGTYQCSLYDAGIASCVYFCPGGRRPENYRARRRVGIGGYLATMHALEAASVPAFERLAAELEAYGASRRLIDAARAARSDEIRHAKMTKALAQRFGVNVRKKRISVGRVRSLERVAQENAVEGCVLETFGALVATWQAERASDPVVRAAMKKIARDETRHAELAFRVDEWTSSRLSPAARTRVTKARVRAARYFLAKCRDPERELSTTLGLPSRAEARALFAAVAPSLGLAELRGSNVT